VLTDAIKSGFDAIFTQSYRNSDAVITGKIAFSGSAGNTVLAPSVPARLLAEVRALPSVGVAVGSIADQAQLIDRNGKAIVNGGAPNLALGIDPAVTTFNPLTLVEGTWPRGPEAVLIDAGTAKKHHFRVGDRIEVAAQGPAQRFRISGIARFGAVS